MPQTPYLLKSFIELWQENWTLNLDVNFDKENFVELPSISQNCPLSEFYIVW